MADVAPLDPERIVRVLARHHVRYVLIGALAARLQGFPRLTADIDITPESDERNLERLASALRELDAKVCREHAGGAAARLLRGNAWASESLEPRHHRRLCGHRIHACRDAGLRRSRGIRSPVRGVRRGGSCGEPAGHHSVRGTSFGPRKRPISCRIARMFRCCGPFCGGKAMPSHRHSVRSRRAMTSTSRTPVAAGTRAAPDSRRLPR